MVSTQFILGTFLGFILFWAFSHPTHPRSFKNKLPAWNLKWLEWNPRRQGSIMRLKVKSYQVHLHHWINLGIIYFLFSVYPSNFLDPHNTLQGFIFGGLAQGLMYPDRFQIIKRLKK